MTFRTLIAGSALAVALGFVGNVARGDDFPGWWVDLPSTGSTVELYDSAPDDRNDESFYASLTCPHGQGDSFVDTSVLVIDSEQNGPAAQSLVASYGKANAVLFTGGGKKVETGVFGLELGLDDMAGAWDVTIHLADSNLDLMKQLAPLAGSADFKMTIGKAVYDLAVRPEDRSELAGYLAKCN